MSVSIVLLPMAIALISTVGTGVTVSSLIRERLQNKKGLQQEIEPIPTQFTNITLLEKTLTEHGLKVEVVSENELVCATENWRLTYQRVSAGSAFSVTASGPLDFDELIAELECFDEEYKQNVQSYTYNKLISNLAANNMTLHSETVLEDNSILLTINV